MQFSLIALGIAIQLVAIGALVMCAVYLGRISRALGKRGNDPPE